MKIDKHHKLHLAVFGGFAGLLFLWFVYAGNTGWRVFSSGGNKQTWSSSGPGYHK